MVLTTEPWLGATGTVAPSQEYSFYLYVYVFTNLFLFFTPEKNCAELTGHFIRNSPRLQTQRGRPPRPPSLCLLECIGVLLFHWMCMDTPPGISMVSFSRCSNSYFTLTSCPAYAPPTWYLFPRNLIPPPFSTLRTSQWRNILRSISSSRKHRGIRSLSYPCLGFSLGVSSHARNRQFSSSWVSGGC